MELEIFSRNTPAARVEQNSHGGWLLTLPPGSKISYRWAQLDDYLHYPRNQFKWTPPLCMELRARVSAQDIPGTWGFGFWNDPFNASLGLNGMARRLPALPNTAWFFYASPPNHLALSDHHPASGLLAATFSSPLFPSLLLAPAALALPLLVIRPAARLLRKLASHIIHEDAACLDIDATQWHSYRLDWNEHEICFYLDDAPCFRTFTCPRGRLGFVLWIDNQYAAFTPQGSFSTGKLAFQETAWMEIDDLQITPLQNQ